MATRQRMIGAACLRALCIMLAVVASMSAQEIIPPSVEPSVRLEAEQQRKEGDLFFADGKVEIQYKNLTLHADHVQYNAKTYSAVAHGNVQLDVETQHITADSAEFNVRSGVGRFELVRGTLAMEIARTRTFWSLRIRELRSSGSTAP